MTSASDTLVIAQLASDVLRLEDEARTQLEIIHAAFDMLAEQRKSIRALREQMASVKAEFGAFRERML